MSTAQHRQTSDVSLSQSRPAGTQAQGFAQVYTHTPYAYMAVPDAYRTLAQPASLTPLSIISDSGRNDDVDGFQPLSHNFSAFNNRPTSGSLSAASRTVPQLSEGAMYYKPSSRAPTSFDLAQIQPAHNTTFEPRAQLHHIPGNRQAPQLEDNINLSGQPTHPNSNFTTINAPTSAINYYPQAHSHNHHRDASSSMSTPSQSFPQPHSPRSVAPQYHAGAPQSMPIASDAKHAAANATRRQNGNGRFHTPLNGICEFLPLPESMPTPPHWPTLRAVETDGSTVRVFIGQVRFETTAEQIAFIIEYVSGVVPAFIAYHRVGCFVAHFHSEAECVEAVRYHKRVYFDSTGVWIAHSDEAVAALAEEIQSVSNGPRRTAFRRRRLPRAAMVMEQFTDTDAGSPMRLGGYPTMSQGMLAGSQSFCPPTPRSVVDDESGDAYYDDRSSALTCN